MQDITSEILSEIEKDKVKKIAEDEVLFEALKKFILAVVYRHGVLEKDKDFKGNVNWALQFAWGATEGNGIPRTDEELGQHLRALTYATKLVESGFKELQDLKTVETLEEPKENPAE